MKTAKVTLTSAILAAALGLALGLMSAPGDSYACHSGGTKHNSEEPCSGNGGGNSNSDSNGKVFPVKVTFDDFENDSIKSDDEGPYVDGVDGIGAEIAVEGTPPGQFSFNMVSKSVSRTLSLDLGPGCIVGGGDLALRTRMTIAWNAHSMSTQKPNAKGRSPATWPRGTP